MSQAGPVGGRGRSSAAVAWIGWWAASAGVYLVLVDSVSLPELVTGSVIAIIGASGATLLRSQRRAVMRPELGWLVRLWRPVARYPVDLVTVTRALVRRRPVQGRLYALAFEPGPDDAPPLGACWGPRPAHLRRTRWWSVSTRRGGCCWSTSSYRAQILPPTQTR